MTIYIFVPFHVQNKLIIGIQLMNAIQYMQDLCLMKLYQRFLMKYIMFGIARPIVNISKQGCNIRWNNSQNIVIQSMHVYIFTRMVPLRVKNNQCGLFIML